MPSKRNGSKDILLTATYVKQVVFAETNRQREEEERAIETMLTEAGFLPIFRWRTEFLRQ
jgi:hypothetical protein